MDTTAAGIEFDAEGRCNYCRNYERTLASYQPSSPEALKKKEDALVERIKREGRNKPYDCIIGLSGGADSAYTLYHAKQRGLRPLAVHMDNGWDSELAANNIENLVRKLGVDLHTHVINWLEYRALMQAYFDADVIDIEVLYDNAMLAVNHQMASKVGVRWILGGTNTTTEGMEMPTNWNWNKFDKRNLRALAKRSGVKLETFPSIGTPEYVLFKYIRRIHWIPFLDYIDYNKPRCTDILVKEVGYRKYAYKHYESVFTRFYQGYILPKKFNVDKRKLHLSTLVMSGQMKREEALETMKQIPYPSAQDEADDIEYFLKKMGWTRAQLDSYIARPEIPHTAYPSEKPLWDKLARIARRAKIVPKRDTIAPQ